MNTLNNIKALKMEIAAVKSIQSAIYTQRVFDMKEFRDLLETIKILGLGEILTS